MFGSLGLGADTTAQAAGAWKRRAWGLAIALAEEGHFGWEDLRQALLVEAVGFDQAQPWSQCRRWLRALSRVMEAAGLVDVGVVTELGQWAERAAARE
ncbi:MAG TPA: hypothetical protein VI299_11855 [Polyangiales bacterium]